MRDLTNSASSRSFNRRLPVGGGVVLVLAAALSWAAVWWFLGNGSTLYYGDAEAHLNIARRIWDNREPAYREIGTVWLPVPHLLALIPSISDVLWRNGMAGAIPSALCFIFACWLFFRALRSSLDSNTSGFVGVTLLAWNPNLLYLQSAPMTEAIFLCCLAGILYSTLKDWVWRAALFTIAATLTRYEGWALIPAVFGYFLLRNMRKTGSPSSVPGLSEDRKADPLALQKDDPVARWRKRYSAALIYGCTASLGPIYWLLHNWWLFGSALYFYDGPWSAKAIYQRQLEGGMQHHPADGNWFESIRYFFAGARLTMGETLLVVGIAGALFFAYKRKKQLWPLLFLSIPPLFYIASLHSGGTPIFLPGLWPDSYYNTRYTLSLLPLLAWGVAAAVRVVHRDWRAWAGFLLILFCFAPWALFRNRQSEWICWKESQVNSEIRRDWTARAGNFMWSQYVRGDGIWYGFGDLTGILRFAGIPLRETLHEGNELQWYSTMARPELFLKEKWVIAFEGSPMAKAVAKLPYETAVIYPSDGKSPGVVIFRRKTAQQP
jgi:hypothetical protein